jgi:hypothetical protein
MLFGGLPGPCQRFCDVIHIPQRLDDCVPDVPLLINTLRAAAILSSTLGRDGRLTAGLIILSL